MPYPKKANIDGFETEIAQIDALRPGQSLPLTGSVDAIDHIRGVLYAYLHQFKVKRLYKINRVAPERLIVTRKPKHKVSVAYEGTPSHIKEFITRHLSGIYDEDEALQLIRDSLEKSDWLETLDEWRRIQQSGESR